MFVWSLVVVAALAGAATVSAADDCGSALGEGSARVESEKVVVVFRTEPAPIAVGRHFSLEAVVCARGSGPAPTGLRVDAHMPEHRHGMNYRTTVTSRGGGRYVAEGLLFHMPGHWQLLLDVDEGGRTERLVSDVIVE